MSVVHQKSFQLCIDAVNLSKKLVAEKREYVLSKQLLKSASSVAANAREGKNAESRKDFIHKYAIAQKEADETKLWLEVLVETNYISLDEFDVIYNLADEVYRIITSIIVTTKKRN